MVMPINIINYDLELKVEGKSPKSGTIIQARIKSLYCSHSFYFNGFIIKEGHLQSTALRWVIVALDLVVSIAPQGRVEPNIESPITPTAVLLSL